MIGAVVKARELYKELVSQYERKYVSHLDIFGWKKNKANILLRMIMAAMRNKQFILVISETSTAFLQYLLTLKKIFQIKLHYVLVGASMGVTLRENKERIPFVQKMDAVYVEVPSLKTELEEIGLTNIHILYNFKKLQQKETRSRGLASQDVFRLCVFSRISEDKGVTDAIEAVSAINNQYPDIHCCLDLYGEIHPPYKETFEMLVSNDKNICYCGVIPYDQVSSAMEDYDCFLFPTRRFTTEGLPGSLIDAFAAGLPIISSRWGYSNQFLAENETCIFYPFQSKEGLKEAIVYAYCHPKVLEELHINCLKQYEPYSPQKAIQSLLENLDSV